MDIQTIHMDPRVARIHYRDYIKKVREHRILRASAAKKKITEAGRSLRAARTEKSLIEREDEILLKSFRAIARGERVLDLYKTFQKVGLQQDTQLPALAIAGATWKEVRLYNEDRQVFFAQPGFWWRSRAKGNGPYVSIPQNRFPPQMLNSVGRQATGHMPLSHAIALVPDVPPYLRPDNLEDYHILWEPVWKRSAPIDPILLKRIDGPFYSVIAQWDLTPLEQSVLELRTPS